MKTHIEPINSVSKKVTVSFDEKVCQEANATILKKAQAQAVLPGFRKGKVPFERIRRITGYLVGTLDRFNDAKRDEVNNRVKHMKAQNEN